jgi:hypothetical protein
MLLAVVINKYLSPIFYQKGGKHTLLHTYTCDNPCFHLYPRIIRNAEHMVETSRIGARIWFSGKHKGEKRGERPVQHRIRPSPPHHNITGLEERRPREDRPERG